MSQKIPFQASNNNILIPKTAHFVNSQSKKLPEGEEKSPKFHCMSEALIFPSTYPQYDNRLFIELKVQYTDYGRPERK